MSLSEHPDVVEKSMTDFFQKQKTQEEKTDRSHSEKRLTDIMNQAQADANMSSFFNQNRIADPEKGGENRQKLSYSPQKKGKADPKSLFSRKGVSEREKEQIFLQYYDENLKLRSNQTKLEQHIKELKTKVRVIEGEYVYSKKKFEGDQMVKDDLNFIEDLKRENQSLKMQLKETQLPKPQLPSSGFGKKVAVKSSAKSGGVTSKTSSDHLRLIDLLKMQLKKAEGEIQSLHSQMRHRGSGHGHESGVSDMHDKNVKLATLQHRFENLDGAFSSQKQMLDKHKQMIEDLNKQLYQERTRNNQLEVQLRSAELAAATAKDLQLQLEEAEREKKMLEAKYKDLVESPFFKDIHEKAANPARLREAENQLNELKTQLKTLHDQNTANEKQIIELKAQLKTTALEREKLKDEKTKAEAILQEKERTQGFLDKQMEIFNISNDRERDNFLKALGMVRLQGEEPAWKRLEFIERHGELDINNVPSLLKEIDRLRLEKSEIAAQLEKAQTLLHTHLEMEKDKDIIHKAESDKLQLQLKSANNRIEELTKLADFRARNYRDNMLKSGISFKPYDEGASEFSEITESELASTENTLDVLVRNCEFDELVLRKLLGGKVLELEGLQTMIAVDFYNHETQNSEICEGMKPNYNFQVAFKVNVDENLITYMENEFLRIEIYAIINSDLKLIGTTYASYRELLIKNYDIGYGSSAVVLLNSIIYGERKSDIIGVMKLKMRMRHPMSEALRWVKEKSEFMKDTQEQLDIRMDPTLKSRKLIIQVDKVTGLDKRAATFVYYKLYNLKDNYTPTVPGNEPVFNYISTHDLAQNESVRHYLEKESLEFVVFDDAQPLIRNETRVQSNQLGDVLGRGKIRLSPLLENQPIDQFVPIYNIRSVKVASIHVRLYWFDMQDQPGIPNETNNLTKIWEENMTRNIAASLRMKGQTLESAFQICDNDGDGKVGFEEFRDAIMRTFKVKVKEEELVMYWKRLNLTQGSLYREEFFSRFAPYMSQEDNLRVTQQRFNRAQEAAGYPGRMPQLGQFLDQNTQDLQYKFDKNSETLGILCKKLAQRIYRENLPIDVFLSKFDRNANGYISRQEMRTSLYELGINLTETEIENLLVYFDINNDNMVSTEEFKILVRSGVLEELQRLKPGSPGFQKTGTVSSGLGRASSLKVEGTAEEARREVLKFLCDHIRANNMTLLQFTKSIDADASGSIKRDELAAFFKKIGMKIEKNELEGIFEELDPKNTNNVPIKKFVDVLAPYIKEKPKITSGIEQALHLIANHILDLKMDVYMYFNNFDSNKNGFIERKELKIKIQDMGIIISDIELNNLLNFFDDNQDGRISSKEFITHLQPYLNTAKKIKSQSTGETPSSRIIDDLKLKCHNIVRKNSGNLLDGFKVVKEERPGALVSQDNFGKVLLSFKLGFTPAEIDLITEYLTDKNGDGLVYYEKFLKSYSDPKFDKDLTESQALSSYGEIKPVKRLSSAEEIFNRMAKVLKQNNISSKEAFKIFDKDQSGKISTQELRDAFAGMQLGLTRDEINDVVRHIDKTGDGTIDYKEFIAALKL